MSKIEKRYYNAHQLSDSDFANAGMNLISDAANNLYTDNNSHVPIDKATDPYPLQANYRTANVLDVPAVLRAAIGSADIPETYRSYINNLSSYIYYTNDIVGNGLVEDVVRSSVVSGFNRIAKFDYGIKFDRNALIEFLGERIENATKGIAYDITSVNFTVIKCHVMQYFISQGTTLYKADPARRSAVIEASCTPFAECIATNAAVTFANIAYGALARSMYSGNESDFSNACDSINPIIEVFRNMMRAIVPKLITTLMRDRTPTDMSDYMGE